jgi:pentatricopeptide repeat-containing protein PET309
VEHYETLAAAFLKTGEPDNALRVLEMMNSWGLPQTTTQVAHVISALGDWQRLPGHHEKDVETEARFVKAALVEFWNATKRGAVADRNPRFAVSVYSRMILLLTQMQDTVSVQQIIDLFRERFSAVLVDKAVPTRLLHNIMLDDLYQKRYDRVKSTWEMVLDRTYRSGRLATLDADETVKRAKISPAFLYRLSEPLKIIQRVYSAEGDADGLIRLIANVRSMGFEMDGRNWNYYVQALSRLGRWEQAFTICETELIPNWTGWPQERVRQKDVKYLLPLELRRLSQNPQHARPNAHTLFQLRDSYHEMDEMRHWSQEVTQIWNRINEKCQRTVRAVKAINKWSPERTEVPAFTRGPVPQKPTEVVPEEDRWMGEFMGSQQHPFTEDGYLGLAHKTVPSSVGLASLFDDLDWHSKEPEDGSGNKTSAAWVQDRVEEKQRKRPLTTRKPGDGSVGLRPLVESD